MEEIVNIPIGLIKPYGKNAKTHPGYQVEQVAASIKEFDWQQPIVLDKNNTIIIGHARYEAAKKLGMTEVPCVVASKLTKKQANALRLADNKVAESDWDLALLKESLEEIPDFDMSVFGFDDMDLDWLDDFQEPANEQLAESGNGESVPAAGTETAAEGQQVLADPCTKNVFENQERMQFETKNWYGIPEIPATETYGDKLVRFCDKNSVEGMEGDYIAHFFYDDFKFIEAWRDPDKYVSHLKKFKAVIAPDFSFYIDFPHALQILSCYRRQWCAAYWHDKYGIDIIPNVRWGEKDTFSFCFDGLPRHSVVAYSTVGIANDGDWNGKNNTLLLDGWKKMLEVLEPRKIILYGSVIDGMEGDIIRVPTHYEERMGRYGKTKKAGE